MSDIRAFEYGDHWLTKREDSPNYYIYWCREGSRRVRRKSTGTGDLEEAKQRLVSLVEGRRTSLPIKSKEGNAGWGERNDGTDGTQNGPTVEDCLSGHFERVGVTQASAATQRHGIKLWSKFCELEDIVFVRELSLERQEQYIEWRRRRWKAVGKSLSNGTLNRELSVLRAALRDAWRRGQIPGIPHVLHLPTPPARDRFLNVEEIQCLLAACDIPHLRRYVLLALHTLQRPSHILALRVEQVDLANNRINFLPPGATQSSKRRPVVPITETLKTELDAAIRQSHSGYLVEYEGSPVKTVKRAFARAARKAGFTRISPYVLRRTGATLLAASGVSMRQIAGMLGHTTQRTTELYAQHQPEFLAHAASTLDQLFGARDTGSGLHPSRTPVAATVLANLRASDFAITPSTPPMTPLQVPTTTGLLETPRGTCASDGTVTQSGSAQGLGSPLTLEFSRTALHNRVVSCGFQMVGVGPDLETE